MAGGWWFKLRTSFDPKEAILPGWIEVEIEMQWAAKAADCGLWICDLQRTLPLVATN
jgi:hypothetical protein